MHSKKYKKIERRGLPGGPNEQIIYTDINISTEGYKLGSPDFNNPYNIIPSSYITMVDVPFSVLGTDNLGNSQLMEPGKNYKFPGDMVFETPMAQDGGGVARESTAVNMPMMLPDNFNPGPVTPLTLEELEKLSPFEQHQYRLQQNLAAGAIPSSGKIRASEAPSTAKKVMNRAANPMSAFKYFATGEQAPEMIPDKEVPLDYAMDVINPFAWLDYATKAGRDIREGDYVGAAFNALGATPVIPATAKPMSRIIKNAPSRVNPNYFKPNEDLWYRQVGKSAIDDISKSKMIRERGEDIAQSRAIYDEAVMKMRGIDPATGKEYTDHTTKYQQMTLGARKPPSPYFSKGELFWGMDRKPGMKGLKGRGLDADSRYLIESKLSDEAFHPAYVKGLKTDYSGEKLFGETAILKPMPEFRNPADFNLYRRNWWSGYKPIRQEGGETVIPTWLNPMNWGVEDYSEETDFNKAFSSARKAGEKEFMWNGKRFSTKKDTDSIYKDASLNEYAKLKYPNYIKSVNRNFDLKSDTIPSNERAYFSPNKNKIYYNDEETFNAELAHEVRNEKTLMDDLKYRIEKKKYSEDVYDVPNTLEYETHRLTQPGLAFAREGNLSEEDIKKVQNYLGVKPDGFFHAESYKALVDKYYDEKEVNAYLKDNNYTVYDDDLKTNNLKYPYGDIMGSYYLNKIAEDKNIRLKSLSNNPYYYFYDPDFKGAYYSDKELSELDTNKKNFDTLALQRELSNRGFKLPKSTKEDGSFDGILGNETKQALLDWQSKNKKQEGGETDPKLLQNEGAWDATKGFFGFQRGGSVSEVWQQVTGTPWAQAKAQGLTDGSYDANINLRKQLLANPEQFKLKQTPAHDLTPANTPSNASNPTLSPEEVNDKINQAKDFNSAFKIARDYYGPNKIFSYKNKQFGTNLRGETFQPSEEDMVTAGLKPKQREAIQQQNRLVVSPYTTTNSVEFDQFEDIEKVKKNTEDLNKLSQVDLIVSYQSTHAKDPYLVVDENMGRMHLYYPGQTEPMESYPILSGANTGDAQTVTKADYFYKGEKLDQAGLNEAMRSTGAKSVDQLMEQPGYSTKINWDAGNKTTGAGKFTIGIVNEDSGFFDDSGRGRKTPSFVLRNEQGNDVSTVIHTVPSRRNASRLNALANADPENSRMTNGCINGRCSDLIDMNKIHNVGEGTQVFVLPEDEGNQFVFENGQLNFKAKSGKDYNTYIDSEGNVQRGQGINRSRNTLNYRPIQIEVDEEQFQNDKFTYFDFDDEEEYKNVVVPYVKSLQDNKQKIMKVMQVNGDAYNEIAKVSFGILGNESNFGDTHSAAGNLVRAARKWKNPLTSSSPDYQSKFDTYKAQGDYNSVGLTQFRWGWVEEDAKQGGDLKERLATLGITGNRDFLDAEKAALATTAILAYYYNNRKVDDIMNDLPKHYAGIIKRDPNRVEYTKNVKNNAKYLTIKEKQYQGGGETIHNVSKGDTFYGIANKYGVSFKDLTNANPDINIQKLSIDQPINIPVIKGDVTEVSKDVATSGLTDALFMRQAYKESTFRPDAKSGAGALGLTQIMPNTLADYKKATGETDVDLTNIDDAIKVQKWAMNDLYNASFINKDNQSPEVRLAKTLASYNWGRGNMLNYLNKKKKAGDDIYNSLDWVDGLPDETKDYIDKILGNNEKFNEEFNEAITNEDNVSVIRGYGQSRGGEIHKELFNIYKNYMNGMYDDTPYFKEGSEVYDKLNRVYYSKAKAKGMSSPNYIMSYIIN